MIIIKYNVIKKEYQRIKPPLFKTRIEEILWLKNEMINCEVHNIKYVYISKNDILMMKKSNDININNIYNMYKDNNGEYIKIINNDQNKKIIHTLLNTEWLTILNNVIYLTQDKLNEKIDDVECKINNIKEKKKNESLSIYINNSIELLEYKKEELYNVKEYKSKGKKIKYKNKRHN